MGDILSIIGIAVLLVLLVASVRKVRAQEALERIEADTRTDSNLEQHERSQRHRADVRAGRAPSQPVTRD